MTAPAVIPNRTFAGLFDLSTDGPTNDHGVCPGSEYIGGYGGVGWYQYYTDAKTGEVYSVRCTDGVNGGRGPRSDANEEWLTRCYYEVISRCHREAKLGKTEIRISRNERAVMHGMTHDRWLASAPGLMDGVQSKEGLDGGFVGHSHGVPVICDLEKEDEFPPRIGEQTVKDALKFTGVRHTNADKDEIFIGDYQTPIMSHNIPWKTLRLGPSARDSRGRLTSDRHVPLFIQKSELDEAVEALQKWEARQL